MFKYINHVLQTILVIKNNDDHNNDTLGNLPDWELYTYSLLLAGGEMFLGL